MDDVVGVCFKPTGKVYYFSAKGFGLRPGEAVVAETSRGQELAEVVCTGPTGERGKGKLKPILRRATGEDVTRGQDNRHRAEEARRVCQRLLKQMDLAVKLVEVEYAFDGSHIVFAFASDDRTDFRELQRRLREIYDCEVEIRQIGVRDQAKILGGLGPCGRHLCCSSFLRQFHPVTIRMAKDQDIALNPTKISGQCGRLMCCLRYEHESYRDARMRLPEAGAQVQTRKGDGEVTAVDVIHEVVTVATPDGPVKVAMADVTSVTPKRKGQPPPPVEPKAEPTAVGGETDASTETPTRRRGGSRRRKSKARAGAEAAPVSPAATPEPPPAAGSPGEDTRRRRSRRRRPRRGGGRPGSPAAPAVDPPGGAS
jgi:cell fate regulator YaaT (PSP1 superfamily)